MPSKDPGFSFILSHAEFEFFFSTLSSGKSRDTSRSWPFFHHFLYICREQVVCYFFEIRTR